MVPHLPATPPPPPPPPPLAKVVVDGTTNKHSTAARSVRRAVWAVLDGVRAGRSIWGSTLDAGWMVILDSFGRHVCGVRLPLTPLCGRPAAGGNRTIVL